MKPFKGKDKAKADGNRIWAPKRGNSRDKDDDLVRDFQNVGLNPKQDDDSVDGRRDSASSSVSNGTGSSNSILRLPRRPEAENCLVFLRTGSCRFGLDCKYNHPAVKRTYRVDKETGNEKAPQGSSKKYSDIACKFYETDGGCRNGEYCRFNHSKPVSENALNEIKSSEEEERSFYIPREEECSSHMNREEELSSDMHTSSCGYGAYFRFHNSDPNNAEDSDPYGSVINCESMGCYGEVSEFNDSDTLHMHFSESAHAYGFSPLIAYYNAPYADDCCSYMPMTYLDPEGLHQNLGWNSTQLQRCSQCARLLTADNFMNPEDQHKQDEQFPKAQGQPVDEEDHHKAPCAKREPCVLNDVGLPLRPGKQICWHYKNLGLCKFGRACAFDHPMKKPSTQSDPSKAGTEFHI